MFRTCSVLYITYLHSGNKICRLLMIPSVWGQISCIAYTTNCMFRICFERMLTIIIYIPDVDNIGSYRRIRMGCRDIVQLSCLIVAMVLSTVSCIAPYCITDKQGDELYHEGLWTRCPRGDCDWFHKDWWLLQQYNPGG